MALDAGASAHSHRLGGVRSPAAARQAAGWPRRLRRVTDEPDGRPAGPGGGHGRGGAAGPDDLPGGDPASASGSGCSRTRAADSAAQVCAGVHDRGLHDARRPARLRRRLRRGDVRPRARAGRAPGRAGAGRARSGPGAAALRYTQDKLAMRERLTRLGVPCPRYAPVAERGRGGRASPRTRAGRWCSRRSAAATTGAGSGCAGRPPRPPRCWPHGSRCSPRSTSVSTAELAALVARSPHGQGAAYPVVQTVQRDGVCHEVLAPAPGLRGRPCAGTAQRLALELAGELGVTGLLAVELFETPRRAAGQRAGDAAAQQRSLDHRGGQDVPVRAAPAGRARPAARRPPQPPPAQAVMANVFGGDRPGRVRAVHARDGGRPGREGAPVRQAGAARPQDRPRHRARRRPARTRSASGPCARRSYLATGKELSA